MMKTFPVPQHEAMPDYSATRDVIAVQHVLDLPRELLDEVFSYLSVPDICASIQVCRLFHALAEPHLYRDITVLRSSQAAALVNAFQENPARVKWIRSLLVSTKFGDDGGLHALPPWIIEVRSDHAGNAVLPRDPRRTDSSRWTIYGTFVSKRQIAT
jgi:hypothetical protein